MCCPNCGHGNPEGAKFCADCGHHLERACGECGTPMTYDWGGDVEIAIATLDDPNQAPPLAQVNVTDKLDFVDQLHQLPVQPSM